MLYTKSKKTSKLFLIYVMVGFLSPTLTQADSVNSWGGDSGQIDAGKAAAQRAAIAKRAAKKQKALEEKKAAEEKKTAEEQKTKTEAN